jgi:chromosome segregation ATPase
MLTSLIVVALPGIACAFLAGWVFSKAYFHSRATTRLVPAARHRERLQALRRRYRRRFRTLRDMLVQSAASRDQLRNALTEMENRYAAKAELLSALEREAAETRARIEDLEHELRGRERAVADWQANQDELRQQLQAAQDKIVATEHEHGLLRIEHDELAARTQRLKALPRAAAANGGGNGSAEADNAAAADDTRAAMGALREGLAERDGRIHELECKLTESESRSRELETSLRTWKLRIAPLAMQLRLQRERARRALAGADAPAAPAEAGPPPSGSARRPRSRRQPRKARSGPV